MSQDSQRSSAAASAEADNYYHRGESRLRLRQFQEADRDLTLAVEKGCTDPAAYNARAMARRNLGDHVQVLT